MELPLPSLPPLGVLLFHRNQQEGEEGEENAIPMFHFSADFTEKSKS